MMVWGTLIEFLFLSYSFLGSSAKLDVLECQLDNPNYFEGDLDISQTVIDAFYEQQDGKNVRTQKFNLGYYDIVE